MRKGETGNETGYCFTRTGTTFRIGGNSMSKRKPSSADTAPEVRIEGSVDAWLSEPFSDEERKYLERKYGVNMPTGMTNRQAADLIGPLWRSQPITDGQTKF